MDAGKCAGHTVGIIESRSTVPCHETTLQMQTHKKTRQKDGRAEKRRMDDDCRAALGPARAGGALGAGQSTPTHTNRMYANHQITATDSQSWLLAKCNEIYARCSLFRLKRGQAGRVRRRASRGSFRLIQFFRCVQVCTTCAFFLRPSYFVVLFSLYRSIPLPPVAYLFVFRLFRPRCAALFQSFQPFAACWLSFSLCPFLSARCHNRNLVLLRVPDSSLPFW